MDSSKRVILNTAVTYMSLILRMAVGLFAVRFILKALGETDYGIYIAVAGVIGLLDFLNANMTNTSMRYLAHSLGSGDLDIVKKTFNSTLAIHYVVAFFTAILMEICGLVLLEYILDIPVEKNYEAHVIFQCMIVTTIISIIAVPYDAVINAHEKIWLLSMFDVLSAILVLCLSVYLLYSDGNRLIIYGFGLMAIQIILRTSKLLYSKFIFEECRDLSFRYVEKGYIKSILSFTGWNLLGAIAGSFTHHLRGIIINVFFGVRLNAAEGISRQVNGTVNMVSVSMTKAINPQLMKSEGSGDRKRMLYLTEIASKYSSFLFGLVAAPLAIELPIILNMWLDHVPDYTVVFCQLSLATMLISKFSFQITHAIQAVGKIRNFQLTETILCLLPLPISYYLFSLGASPVASYIVGLAFSIPIFLFRIYFGKKITGLNIWKFIRYGILSTLIPLLIATLLTILFVQLVPASIWRIPVTFVVNIFLFAVLFWIMGISKDERLQWINIIGSIVKRKRQ